MVLLHLVAQSLIHIDIGGLCSPPDFEFISLEVVSLKCL